MNSRTAHIPAPHCGEALVLQYSQGLPYGNLSHIKLLAQFVLSRKELAVSQITMENQGSQFRRDQLRQARLPQARPCRCKLAYHL